MARRNRLHLPATTYHVMLRGNNGQPVFFSEGDRCKMCLLIQEGVERFGHRVHAYCFMSNHIHIAIQVGEISISRIIQNLAFRYTMYFNRKRKRIGHLFQGRFKSIVVDRERYLKKLVRYIHLNPVRAGMVDLPLDYQWSSHRAYMQRDQLTWLTQDYLLAKFGENRKEAINNYNQYILEGMAIEEELDFEVGCREGVLGDDDFVDDVIENVGLVERREIGLPGLVDSICERYQLSEEELCSSGKHKRESHARSMLALFVRDIENLSLEELGRFLNREPSGLSKLARRLEEKCIKSETTMEEVKDLRKRIFASH